MVKQEKELLIQIIGGVVLGGLIGLITKVLIGGRTGNHAGLYVALVSIVCIFSIFRGYIKNVKSLVRFGFSALFFFVPLFIAIEIICSKEIKASILVLIILFIIIFVDVVYVLMSKK